MLAHEPFHFGIVGRANFVLIVKVRDLGFLAYYLEALPIERQFIEKRPRVVNRNREARVAAGAGRHALGRLIHVVRGFLAGWIDEVELSFVMMKSFGR